MRPKPKKAARQRRGRPRRPASTLQALYRECTGDTTSHQRAIHARFLHQDARRKSIVHARLSGQKLEAIATAHATTRGSITSTIQRTMEAIRKDIAGEPRYNHRQEAEPAANGVKGREEPSNTSAGAAATGMQRQRDDAQRPGQQLDYGSTYSARARGFAPANGSEFRR